MRVWALASCGGLLALTACSAEPSNTPDLGAAPSDTDDSAQSVAQPDLRSTISSPIGRPELQPRQRGGNQARFSPRSPQATAVTSRSGSAGQTLPQAAQLRERLQHLRAQRGVGLAPHTPLTTAPVAALSTPPRPVPQAEAESSAPQTEALPTPADTAVVALPTPLRPNVAAPELGLTSGSGTAIALGPVASTNQASSHPIAVRQHQSYSARSQRSARVIAAASAESSSLTARLHGATAASPARGSATVAAAQPLPQPERVRLEAALAQADIEAETAPLTTATAVAEGSFTTAAAELDSATPHQSNATVALTPPPPEALAVPPLTNTDYSQGRAAHPSSAVPWGESPTIARPESLPLHQQTPQLHPLRPAAAHSTSSEGAMQIAVSERLEVQLPVTQPPAVLESSVAQISIPQASDLPSAHQGQTQLEALIPSSQPEASFKDSPVCVQTSGPPLTLSAAGVDPQHSGQPDLAPAMRLSPAEAALRLDSKFSKSNPTTCREASIPAVEPAAVDNPPEQSLD